VSSSRLARGQALAVLLDKASWPPRWGSSTVSDQTFGSFFGLAEVSDFHDFLMFQRIFGFCTPFRRRRPRGCSSLFKLFAAASENALIWREFFSADGNLSGHDQNLVDTRGSRPRICIHLIAAPQYVVNNPVREKRASCG
jgi:hypothetical protein